MTIYHLDMKVKSLSRVQLFATPWTVAHHAPLFVGSSGRSTEVGCHFLLQRIILTQGSNPGLPHCRQTLYHLSHQEQVRRSGIPISKNFPQFVVIHTVKGFNIINETEVDFFWNSLDFFVIQ